MTRRRPIACMAWLLASGALVACQPASGGDTGRKEGAALPPQSALSAIPLGRPPGQAASEPAGVANPFEGDAAAVAQGKALFSSMNCVYCHGAQGSGLMGPPLNGHGWRYGGAPAQLFNSIHDGRPQGMPAWGARLPSDQIWKLVAYLESLGGALPPATAGMAGLAAPAPSTTGPQVAGQVQSDTAQQALTDSNKTLSPP